MEKKLIRIDASSMGDLHCWLKFYRRVVEQYSTPKESVKICFGSAWHIFRENLALTKEASISVSRALKYYKELWHGDKLDITKDVEWYAPAYLVDVCMKYVTEYGETDANRDFKYIRGDDGKPKVEQTFSIEFYEDEYVKILVQGTIDEIGKFQNGGCIAFGDDKTTGTWKVNDYLPEHFMKNQLRTYYWALKKLASESTREDYKSLFQGRVGGFITGVFLKKEVDKVTFKRSDVFYFTEEDMSEYELMLVEICKKLSDSYQKFQTGSNLLPREGIMNNTCSGNYGTCLFTPVCKAPSREVGNRILESRYTQKSYTPLAFRKSDVK